MKRLTESQIQQAFFDYVNIRKQESEKSNWHNIIATPNEQGRPDYKRINKLKKEGLSKGFPDISILVPTKKYPAYFIELKRKGGTATHCQIEWITRLQQAGYKADLVVTDNPEDLIKAVRIYLGEIKE